LSTRYHSKYVRDICSGSVYEKRVVPGWPNIEATCHELYEQKGGSRTAVDCNRVVYGPSCAGGCTRARRRAAQIYRLFGRARDGIPVTGYARLSPATGCYWGVCLQNRRTGRTGLAGVGTTCQHRTLICDLS